MARLLILILSAFLALSPARGEDVEIGLARETVAISSSFSGTEVVVFGSIEKGRDEALAARDYDVVVVLAGPVERVRVRRKERRAGLWVNGDSASFMEVPSSYTYASSRPLTEVARPEVLTALSLGPDAIRPRPVRERDASEPAFADSLTRLKRASDLYSGRPGGVTFLTPTLFRARLNVPANVPIGLHRAHAYLFRKGEFLMTRSILLAVRKTGFESYVYNLAHRQSFLYGIACVLMAMATGWLAAVIFGKD